MILGICVSSVIGISLESCWASVFKKQLSCIHCFIKLVVPWVFRFCLWLCCGPMLHLLSISMHFPSNSVYLSVAFGALQTLGNLLACLKKYLTLEAKVGLSFHCMLIQASNYCSGISPHTFVVLKPLHRSSDFFVHTTDMFDLYLSLVPSSFTYGQYGKYLIAAKHWLTCVWMTQELPKLCPEQSPMNQQ